MPCELFYDTSHFLKHSLKDSLLLISAILRMHPTLELLIIFLLILGNVLFVMSELAIVSAGKVILQQIAEQGDAKAKVALKASAPNRFLGTVQIGITLRTILSGAYGESTLSKRIIPIFQAINIEQDSAQRLANVLAILLITYLTLTIGELVPKRLGLNHPEPIAGMADIPMQQLSIISAPIVNILSISTVFILRVLGIKAAAGPQITEEKIRVLIEQGTEEGTFEAAEKDMVERVFPLGDRPISSFLTPSLDIVWLNLEDSPDKNRQKIIENRYSPYPVCQEELDNVVGIVPVTDFLERSLYGQNFDIAESGDDLTKFSTIFQWFQTLIHPALMQRQNFDLTVGLRQSVLIPENTHGLKVLEVFKQTLRHMAFIVDEYGVIQRLVTLNDVMIEIVGDLPDADENEEPQGVQREDGSWLLDGMLAVDQFLQLFKLTKLPEEEKESYHTLGGFIITNFGRIPAAAESFQWQEMRFEVMDMDRNRVDKVWVAPLAESDSLESQEEKLDQVR